VILLELQDFEAYFSYGLLNSSSENRRVIMPPLIILKIDPVDIFAPDYRLPLD
jgi:hypothetical protein